MTNIRRMIKELLDKLGAHDFEEFQTELQDTDNFAGQKPLVKCVLENTSRTKTTDLIVQTYPKHAVQIVAKILGRIGRSDLQEECIIDQPNGPAATAPGPSEPKITNSLSVPDAKAFFIKKRGALVRDVKNVKSIVDNLISEGFHAELAAKVAAQETDPDRMRKILDSVTSKALAEVLFNALVEHQKDVMMELVG